MDTIKSLKFWIVMVITILVGAIVPFVAPSVLGGVIILSTVLVGVFYLSCNSGRPILMSRFTRMGLFMGYSTQKGDIVYPDPPGSIFSGLGIGSIVCWVIYFAVGLLANL